MVIGHFFLPLIFILIFLTGNVNKDAKSNNEEEAMDKKPVWKDLKLVEDTPQDIEDMTYEEPEEKDKDNEEPNRDILRKMVVRRGRPRIVNSELVNQRQDRENLDLTERFIHRKQRRIYKKLVSKEQRKELLGQMLENKRKLYEEKMAMEKRKKKMPVAAKGKKITKLKESQRMSKKKGLEGRHL